MNNPTTSGTVPMCWKPLTGPGHIKQGDWLSFTVAGKHFCAQAKLIIDSGSEREEVVYNRKKNHYFVTAMAVDGTSKHKGVMVACAQPAAQAVGESSLDQQLRAAGMLSVAEVMTGTPLDAFIAHAGVSSIETFREWVEMRCAEFLRMKGRRELEGRHQGDELHEWIEAHAAAFREVYVNLRAALDTGGVKLPERVDLASALKTLIGVARTVNRSSASAVRVPSDDELQYLQRKEWIEYLLETCDEAEAKLNTPQ